MNNPGLRHIHLEISLRIAFEECFDAGDQYVNTLLDCLIRLPVFQIIVNAIPVIHHFHLEPGKPSELH